MSRRTTTRPSGLKLTEIGDNEISWEITKPNIGKRQGRIHQVPDLAGWYIEGVHPNERPVRLPTDLEGAVQEVEQMIEAIEEMSLKPSAEELRKEEMDRLFSDDNY